MVQTVVGVTRASSALDFVLSLTCGEHRRQNNHVVLWLPEYQALVLVQSIGNRALIS